MNEETALRVVTITVPGVDYLVSSHNKEAVGEIERMSRSRSYGADWSLSSWRRDLNAINPDGQDGYAFIGNQVQPLAEVSLPLGSLIVARDSSWAKAKWYAGCYIAPVEQYACLMRVEAEGLRTLTSSRSKSWAREILGYLMTNEAIRLEGKIATRSKR